MLIPSFSFYWIPGSECVTLCSGQWQSSDAQVDCAHFHIRRRLRFHLAADYDISSFLDKPNTKRALAMKFVNFHGLHPADVSALRIYANEHKRIEYKRKSFIEFS